MASDVHNPLDDQCSLGLCTDVAEQLRYRRQMTTGKDVVVDETVGQKLVSKILPQDLSTHSSLFEYASYLPSGMVIH